MLSQYPIKSEQGALLGTWTLDAISEKTENILLRFCSGGATPGQLFPHWGAPKDIGKNDGEYFAR